MSGERQHLDFGLLDDITIRNKTTLSHEEQIKSIDNHAEFPSRERSEETQINIKASKSVISNFRKLAKKERYHHGEFLKILIKYYEDNKN